jgi:hypothetical protein
LTHKVGLRTKNLSLLVSAEHDVDRDDVAEQLINIQTKVVIWGETQVHAALFWLCIHANLRNDVLKVSFMHIEENDWIRDNAVLRVNLLCLIFKNQVEPHL